MFQSIQRRWQRALSARAQQQVQAAQEQGGGGGSSLVEDCSLVAQHRICLKKGKGFVQKEKKKQFELERNATIKSAKKP